MAKALTGAMGAHLTETVTTLCTIWEIVRTDGQSFYFTDHDQDIVWFDGNVYKAAVGYRRTATANNDTLSVDNMDLEGIFDPEALDEAELRAGLFDYADVYISFINWADVSMQNIKVRKGKIGEVTWTPQGIFRSELRGLAQHLTQNLLDVYQPECRADLGDSKCKVPILPPVLQRNQSVTLNEINPEFYRVATSAAADIIWPNLIQNPSFESDPLAADVTSVTGWNVTVGEWSIRDNVNGLTADDGSKFLEGGSISACEIRQDINLITTTTISTEKIDQGNVKATFSIRRANAFADDTGRVILQWLNAADGVVGTGLDTGDEEITPTGTWVTRSFTDVVLPQNTRKIRIVLQGDLIAGGVINAAFDNLLLTVTESKGETHGVYENRVYEVTQGGTTASSQPSYNTGIGAETTDGTAILTARDSFTRWCNITEVIDARTFKIFFVDSRGAANDWFNYGGFSFDSGFNDGVTIEIKDFAADGNGTTGTITLFISPPFDLTVGTLGFLYAGCDKQLDTCINKFSNLVNYQGEPFIPGRDLISQFPNITGRAGGG